MPDSHTNAAACSPGHPVVKRAPALLIAGATLSVLLIAAWLPPAPAGVGTHTRLGLPPCGFLSATRMPCATCGMTTAFAHAAHGRIDLALTTQPAGALLALLTAAVALVAGWAAVTGAALAPLGRFIWRPGLFFGVAGMILIAWAYKVMML
ncbi:MAG: DUF2752 domain-containing protein [Phycisphaeraceae bacterium]|nr:DUF2752 domain-containing protein [Phycisphaeraceae bacterium]